ncbi:sugar transferase [Clostridium tarantellae]|uniref:Sugar transferase n=1 Tax=Clostridium tarantellae TaxID=39493 RepID=A0A6I1MRL6_9CLOT|nr:sugar transferase [Clostridium tarantellae]MPQ45108.1 sugar transferase [Clostridium tarantellae]
MVENLELIKELKVSNSRLSVYLILRRLFDILASLIGLALLAPVIIITCIIVRLESKGSPIYCQSRVGCYGREFKMYKIRSMRIDAEKNGAQWAKKNDPRITKAGNFIRKTRLDELPQLYNVLKGDMSIIGPKPEREVFYREFEQNIKNFRDRLIIKPGLTGYAQVNGGYDVEPQEKLNLDLYYINNINFKNDLIILVKTVKVIFTGEGAR